MADNPPTFDPTTGTTPITLPTQDPCCQSPCDPAWRTKSTCIVFNETRTVTLPLGNTDPAAVFAVGRIVVTVTYAHSLCLVGKQHGGLAYTMTLLPGEKMTLFQSDRYRRTTSETERFSVQTTFSQFVSAVHQQQNSKDSSALQQVLKSQTNSSDVGGGGGINLGIFSLGGSGSSSSTSSASSIDSLAVNTSSSDFVSTAQQASQYTDLQRSITISSYEDSETVSTTQRTLVNNNRCYAVTYFVRKVVDVYQSSTRVVAVTFQVSEANFVSGVLTPAQIGQLPAALQKQVEAALKGLPTVGEASAHATLVTVPTDGVVYDPELAHCCAQDPELELADRIKLEREQAEAQRIGLEVQLMALEVQRRQALLAAGTLTPFEPAEC
jgi:thermitase